MIYLILDKIKIITRKGYYIFINYKTTKNYFKFKENYYGIKKSWRNS